MLHRASQSSITCEPLTKEEVADASAGASGLPLPAAVSAGAALASPTAGAAAPAMDSAGAPTAASADPVAGSSNPFHA